MKKNPTFDEECSELAGMLRLFAAGCPEYDGSHFAQGYIYGLARFLAHDALHYRLNK